MPRVRTDWPLMSNEAAGAAILAIIMAANAAKGGRK